MRLAASALQRALLPALVLLLTLLAGGYLWWQFVHVDDLVERQTREAATLRAAQLADAMAGRVGGLLGTMDLGLQQVRAAWLRDPAEVPVIAEAVLATLPEGLPAYLSVVDAEGYTAYTTLKDTPPTYVGDRAHFRNQQSGADRLLIGKPGQARLVRGWTFIVNRPLLREGRFAGTVNISVRADAMAALLGRLKLSDQDLVALVQPDGTFLARSLNNPAAMGKSVPADRPFLAADLPLQGHFYQPGTLDRINRIYAWQRLPDVGLIAAVGLDESVLLAPLHAKRQADRRTAASASALLGLAGLLLAGLLWRDGQRRQREQQIQQTLVQFKDTLDRTLDCVFMFDAETLRFVYVNAGALQQVGYSEAELLAMHPYDIKPEIDAQQFRELISPLLAGEQTLLTFETVHAHKNGRRVPVEIALQYMAPVHAHERAHFVAIVRDIAERKRLENELRELNQSLEQRVAERTAELAASQQLLEDRMSELDSSRAQFLKSQETLSSLIRSPTLGAGFTVAFGHMTEQAAGAFDLSRASIWRLSDDARSIECLDLWESTTRRHSSGLILSAKDYPDYFRLLISDAPIVADDAHTHPGTCEFSAGYLTPLGIASMLDAPIHVNGKLWGVMCFEHIGEPRTWAPEHVGFATGSAALVSLSIEMSLRREAVSSLRTAKDEAERASAAKSEFLSRMSHELRTPLNAILGFSQLLQLPGGDPLNAQQAEHVHEIHHAGEHLLGLVNEVLDLARIESGRLELSPEPVVLQPAIERCVKQIEAMARERRIGVTLRPGEPGTVLADPLRLQQVLLNLLSNAVKYNREGGRIEVDCMPVDGQRVRVSVRDSGPGLSAEQQARLFRPFERLESAYDGIEGTGIGLALAKRLVEGMQGAIGVDSVPGEGSTFWFELPSCPEPAPDDTPAPVANLTASPPGEGRMVLYVEDNPANLKLVRKLFATRAAFTLLESPNAELGLEIAGRARPDLILLDINLPGMDGFEALRHLKENPVTQGIPVIAVTSNAMARDVERGRAAGFADYLTKPLAIGPFLATIDRCLAGAGS